jgi:tetratricopeptide (TPR) repeat protein
LGSWDVTPFGNDEAREWLAHLMEGASSDQVFRALLGAAKIGAKDYFQAPECERAIAAAEIVASARGKPSAVNPPELTTWLSQCHLVAGDHIADVAIKVLDRITANSELKQVWDDTDSASEWYANVEDIQRRLRFKPERQDGEGLPEPPVSIESICEAAAALVSEQKLEEALAKYEEAIQVDPDSQLVYMGRAICHLWLGRHERVVEDINKALSLGQPIPDAYQLRSQAFFHLKKYRNVVADLTSYLRIRPQHYESYFIRALAYEQLKQFQNAVTDFSVIVDKGIAEHLVNALNHRATCFDQIGRPDLAVWDRQRSAQIAAAELYRQR